MTAQEGKLRRQDSARRVALASAALLAVGYLLSCQVRRSDLKVSDRQIGIRVRNTATLPGIGAGQGLTTLEGRVLAYGDAETGVILDLGPCCEVLPEFSPSVHRRIELTVDGRDVVPHPTGLAIQPGHPTFLGNTVGGAGTILTIDLPRALGQGTLDGSIRNSCVDDLAVNGCRPEYVRFGTRWLVATADYGRERNAIRLYDPDRLIEAERTSDPGVLVAEFPCGPWVQSIEWIEGTHQLVLVQNQVAGQLYRLSYCRFTGSQLRVSSVVDLDNPRDELEGFVVTGHDSGFMLSSSGVSNLRSIQVDDSRGKLVQVPAENQSP